MRPSFKIPSRHDLANRLLDNEFKTMTNDVTNKIKEAAIYLFKLMVGQILEMILSRTTYNEYTDSSIL